MAVPLRLEIRPKVATVSHGATGSGTNHIIFAVSGYDNGMSIVAIATGGVAINTPAGWTRLNPADVGLAVFWSRRGGTTTFTSNSNTITSWVSLAIDRADLAIAPAISTVATGTSVSPNAPSVTSGFGDREIAWLTFFASSVASSGTPAGYTVGPKELTAGVSVESAYKSNHVGTEDAGAWTIASSAWRAFTIGIAGLNLLPYVADKSLRMTFNTLDFALVGPPPGQAPVNPNALIVAPRFPFSVLVVSPVSGAGPTWTGTVVKVVTSDYVMRSGAILRLAVTATNTDALPGASAAPFGLSDTPNGTTTFGYTGLETETGTTAYAEAPSSARCTVHRDVGAPLWPGQTVHLKSVSQYVDADFTINTVTVTWFNEEATYAVELGTRKQTLPEYIANTGVATTMPATPIVGAQTYRTDYGLWFRWDGTRWLSVNLFSVQLVGPVAAISATSANLRRALAPYTAASVAGIYITESQVSFYVTGGTALSGTHKWVGTILRNSGATLATVNIDSGASDAWRVDRQVLNAVYGTGIFDHAVTWTKTGTPGTLIATEILFYRVIAT